MDLNQKSICIIGAGLTGLTAAYRLSKQGYKVTVLEATLNTGGMVSAFSIGREKLEHIYHHIFTSDNYVTDLADELGIGDTVSWHKPKDGIFIDNEIFPFSSPLDLLKFKPIPFMERIRTGLSVLSAKRVKDYSKLEKMTARAWLEGRSGKKAYEKLWQPLLRSKFDHDSEQVSAVWIWNKFKLRGNSRDKSISSEMLGYMEGSFVTLVDALIKAIEDMGGRVLTGYTVFGITRFENKFKTACVLDDCSSLILEFDSVIASISASRFNSITSELGLAPDYRHKAAYIKYKANLCLVLRLRESLSDYYWTTICDDKSFVVVVEHTRLTGLKKYGGHIVYLSRYLDLSDPLWTKSDAEAYRIFRRELADIYPNFKVKDVKDWRLTRTAYSQPVIGKEYSKKMPPIETGVDGVFLAGMAQIYPEDRGMNYAIRLGNQVSEMADLYLKETEDESGHQDS